MKSRVRGNPNVARESPVLVSEFPRRRACVIERALVVSETNTDFIDQNIRGLDTTRTADGSGL